MGSSEKEGGFIYQHRWITKGAVLLSRHHCLDAADAGTDGFFFLDLERPQFAGVGHVGTAADFFAKNAFVVIADDVHFDLAAKLRVFILEVAERAG